MEMEDFPKGSLVQMFQSFQVFPITHPTFTPVQQGKVDNSLVGENFDWVLNTEDTISVMAKYNWQILSCVDYRVYCLGKLVTQGGRMLTVLQAQPCISHMWRSSCLV